MFEIFAAITAVLIIKDIATTKRKKREHITESQKWVTSQNTKFNKLKELQNKQD